MRYLMLALATVVATGMVACGKKNDSVANPQASCVNGVCGPGVGGGYGVGYNFGLSSNRFGGTIENVGTNALAQMLGQYGGMCQNNGWNNNPSQLGWSTTFGSWNCKNYAKAGHVKIRFDGTGTRVQVKVGARGSYGMVHPEVLFEGHSYPVNNSAGMEIRASGVQGTGSWSAQYDNGLVIVIQNGSPATLMMTGEVTYRGQPIGTVRFYKY